MRLGRAFLSIFLLTAVILPTAEAQKIQEDLPFTGTPEKQWIIVVDEEEIRAVDAEVHKTPRSLKVSAFVSGLPEEALVAGAARLEGGEVISTALHSPWIDEMSTESVSVAHEKKRELLRIINSRQQKIKELESDMQLLNVKIRHAAGLEEVDRIYERITAIDDSIVEVEKAQGDLAGAAKLQPTERESR